jgi:glycosyltransferase involved in cell wall biosynthesis
MRLVFVVPLVATRDNDTYRVNANYGRLVDRLAPHFGDIEVLAAMPSRSDESYYPAGRSLYRYSIAAPNVHLTPIPISLSTDGPMTKAWAWLRRFPGYGRAIRRADVAYIAMPGLSSLMACALCRLFRRPYMLYYASDWPGSVPFMARWGSGRSASRELYRRLARWAEALPVRRSLFTLATGRRLREHLSRFGSRVFETRPMIAIGPGDFFERQDTCGGSTVKVLYVGALLPGKGVHFLIDAMEGLRERDVPVHLTLVGASEALYASGLRRVVTAKKLDDRVTFAGFVSEIDDLLKYYRQADVLVLPTLSEGFPRVLYEGMSQSLPVVATSIPAIAAVLQDGQQALLVQPGSASALAEAIDRIASQPELRRRLIAKGFAFASDRLTGISTGEQILELLEQYSVPVDASARPERGKDM